MRPLISNAIALVLPESFIELRPEELEVVERQRNVDVVVLVWTLILGWPAAAERTIASLKRGYEWAAGQEALVIV